MKNSGAFDVLIELAGHVIRRIVDSARMRSDE